MEIDNFSKFGTWKFFEFLISKGFKFEFYLNDTYSINSKYIPVELNSIFNLNKSTEFFDLVTNSIFSINEKMIVLSKIKVDFLNGITCFFPIEVKYDRNNEHTRFLIDEMILENNVKLDSHQNIMNYVNEKCEFKFENNFKGNIDSTLNSIESFLDSIWGCNDTFWDVNEIANTTIENWHKKLCNSDCLVTIYGELILIPESLIHEYFESEGLDLIDCDSLSTDSKQCIENIKYLLENDKEYKTIGFVPKFTWSTPTDATWVLPDRTICCKTLEEAFLLLKASTKVSEDIDKARKMGVRNSILIREYIPTLNDMLEFRVFIGGHKYDFEYKIIGISQRNICNYYKELSQQSIRKKIIENIFDFFKREKPILEIFHIFNTKFLAFDIYLLSKKTKYSVVILDIQPLISTSTLLFNLSELKLYFLSEHVNDFDILRIVEDEYSTIGLNDKCLKGTVPEEFLDFKSKSNFDTNKYLGYLEWD